MIDLPTPAAWRERAACATADQDIFYPDVYEGWDETRVRKRRRDPYAEARALCASCPVRDECLLEELSLARSDQHGFRGGLEPAERRLLITPGRRSRVSAA
jgi:hypothetical protein